MQICARLQRHGHCYIIPERKHTEDTSLELKALDYTNQCPEYGLFCLRGVLQPYMPVKIALLTIIFSYFLL